MGSRTSIYDATNESRMKKAKPYLISIGAIALAVLTFYYFGEIILPFFVGLFGAYFADAHVTRLQRLIPNRDLAVTTYLIVTITLTLGILVLFGAELVGDVQRLNDAFVTFTEDHQAEIDEASEEIKSYIELIYQNEELQETLNSGSLDSSSTEYLNQALSGIMSFLEQGGEKEPEEKPDRSINWLVVLFSSIGYFFFILYTFKYFEQKFEKYFGGTGELSGGVNQFIADFRRIFLDYLQRRTWIVLICSAIFTTTFLILAIPGAILLGILAGLLCYIAHFHYFALLPLALCSWVRAIETDQHFFLYFGIIIGVFVLVSVLEELVLYPKIMEEISSINPAIFMVFAGIWTHLFGGIIGTFIALPLTTALLIYADRLLLYWKKQREVVEREVLE